MKFSTMKALFGNSGDGEQSTPATSPNGDLPSPDYNDFNYWKPNLPDIDDEITVLLDKKPKTKKAVNQIAVKTTGKKTEEVSQFNSFNFWKDPLPEIDLDIL